MGRAQGNTAAADAFSDLLGHRRGTGDEGLGAQVPSARARLACEELCRRVARGELAEPLVLLARARRAEPLAPLLAQLADAVHAQLKAQVKREQFGPLADGLAELALPLGGEPGQAPDGLWARLERELDAYLTRMLDRERDYYSQHPDEMLSDASARARLVFAHLVSDAAYAAGEPAVKAALHAGDDYIDPVLDDEYRKLQVSFGREPLAGLLSDERWCKLIKDHIHTRALANTAPAQVLFVRAVRSAILAGFKEHCDALALRG